MEHPLFSAYILHHWARPSDKLTKKELLTEKQIFARALDDSGWCMSVHWASIRLAGVDLDYAFNLGNACHEAYSYGWDHSYETKELKKLFKNIVYPVPLDKELKDYL